MSRKRSAAPRNGEQTGQKAPSGHITGFPDAVFLHPAFRELKLRAIAVLLAISHRHRKYNNGNIIFSIRDGYRFIGLQKATTSHALRELQAAGFIEVTQKGTFTSKRLASSWAVTWEDVGSTPATHAYRDIWGAKKARGDAPG